LPKKLNNYIKIFLPISVGVFCIYYSFRDINFSDFTKYFYEINYLWVFVGIFLGALSHISRSYRWKFLLNPLGYKIRFVNSLLSVFSAYLINYTIPRAGDIARATMISKYEKIPLEKTLGTIAAERAVDVICILIIICVGLIVEFNRLSEKLILLLEKRELSTILLYMGSFLLLLFIMYAIIKKTKYYKTISNFLKGVIEGLAVVFTMKKRNAFIFHSIFIWLMYILMFWATSRAFTELHELTFFQLMISFTLAALSVMFSNGGIGIYPLAVEETLGWYSIQSTTGLAFGWVSWISQTMMVVIFGGLSLFVLPFINRNNS
tara:strand:+ start:842 stop:1801 length:960 start_codon:yes stop_codon:yes gene_type:complete